MDALISDLTPLRAVSYVRVSTTRQASGGSSEEEFSIPAQREANRRRAHELGALVVAEFIDRGHSGRSLERPELTRMLDYIVSSPVDYVIVHKIDRPARNRGDDATVTDRIVSADGRLISTTEAISPTPSGRLLHGIMASIAEFYSQNLANEVMKGLRQKALQGGTPGKAPLGYLNQRKLVEGREIRYVVPDPERAEHITWAFHAYASGKWSTNEIVAELDRRGMTTRPGPNTPSRPLTLRSVHHMLRNPYYQGIVTFNGAEHEGSHEPLVDPVTWATVQDMLAARRNGERSRVHGHYLKGTVFCIVCGRRLVVQNTKSRSGRIYPYFVCTRRPPQACEQRKALSIPKVEEQVAELYSVISLTVKQRERIEEVALARLHHEQAVNEGLTEELGEAVKQVQGKQEKLIEVYYGGAITRDLFDRTQKNLRNELVETQRKLSEAQTTLEQLARQLSESLDLLQDAYTAYRQAEPHIRKQLNQALFTRVLLGPDQIEFEFTERYDKLISDAIEP